MLKKKKMLILIAIVVVIGILAVVATGKKKQEKEDNMVDTEKVQDNQPNIETQIKYPASGSLGENLSEFVIQNETMEISTGLSDDYLKSINYTVLEVDEEKKIAVIEVEIPDILTELERIVENAIQQNPAMEYEELLPIVRENLQNCMESEKISVKKKQVEIAIENVEGTYKLVPSEELEDVLYKDLEEAYLEILLSGWEK